MTVAAQIPFNSYSYAGSSTFVYSFQIISSGDLAVTVDGVAKAVGTDYTVSGVGDQAGGSITYLGTLTTGQVVALRRSTTRQRTTDYQTNGDLRATQVNSEFDNTIRMLQEVGQVAEQRALRVPVGETVADLPSAANRANKVQAYDSSGNPVLIVGVDSASAAALSLDLADTASATKNAGQIGALWSLNYAARTVGNDLRYGSIPSIFKVLTAAQQADVLAYGYTLDLTATITAAYALCKTWYFPTGGYKISGATALTMPGNGSVMTGDGDLTVFGYTGSGTAINVAGFDYCEFSRFKLTTSTGAIGIDLPFASHFWQIDKLHIYGFSTAGVRGTSSYYGTLMRSDIEQCAVGLLGVQDFNGNFINNNSFRGNLRGIWIRDVALNSDGNQIINNEFEDSGRAGVLSFIDVEGADGTTIIANRLESSVVGLTADIYIHGGTGVAGNSKVIANYISGSSTDVPSIRVGGASGLGAKNTSVKDNTCLSATAANYAVLIDASATYTTYTGHRRDLGDGAFNVLNSSASTVLNFVDDSAFSVGITGLTTTPTTSWKYQIASGVVTLFAQTLNGTSNTAACTLTGLPALIRPTNSQTVLLTVQENGTTQLGKGVIDSGGVITLSSSVAGAAFTASGSKGFIGCVITYPIN